MAQGPSIWFWVDGAAPADTRTETPFHEVFPAPFEHRALRYGYSTTWAPPRVAAVVAEARPVERQQPGLPLEHRELRSAYSAAWGPPQPARAALETRPYFHTDVEPVVEPRALRAAAFTAWGPGQGIRASLETRPNFHQQSSPLHQHLALRDDYVTVWGTSAAVRASLETRPLFPQVVQPPAEHAALRDSFAESFGPSQASRAALETRPLFPQQAGPAWTPRPEGNFTAWGPLGRDAPVAPTRPVFGQAIAPLSENQALRSGYVTVWGPTQAVRASLETRPLFPQVIERPLEHPRLRDSLVAAFGPSLSIRASLETRPGDAQFILVPGKVPQGGVVLWGPPTKIDAAVQADRPQPRTYVAPPAEHPDLRRGYAISFGPEPPADTFPRPLPHQFFGYPDTGPPTRRPSAFVTWGPAPSAIARVIPHLVVLTPGKLPLGGVQLFGLSRRDPDHGQPHIFIHGPRDRRFMPLASFERFGLPGGYSATTVILGTVTTGHIVHGRSGDVDEVSVLGGQVDSGDIGHIERADRGFIPTATEGDIEE
jgi:hypothetical protein